MAAWNADEKFPKACERGKHSLSICVIFIEDIIEDQIWPLFVELVYYAANRIFWGSLIFKVVLEEEVTESPGTGGRRPENIIYQVSCQDRFSASWVGRDPEKV